MSWNNEANRALRRIDQASEPKEILEALKAWDPTFQSALRNIEPTSARKESEFGDFVGSKLQDAIKDQAQSQLSSFITKHLPGAVLNILGYVRQLGKMFAWASWPLTVIVEVFSPSSTATEFDELTTTHKEIIDRAVQKMEALTEPGWKQSFIDLTTKSIKEPIRSKYPQLRP